MTLDEILRAITELSPGDQARFDAWFRAFIAARGTQATNPANENATKERPAEEDR